MKILIVEDDSVNQLIIKKLLVGLGFQVVAVVDSYNAAIHALQSYPETDVALIDIDLIGSLSGIDLAKKITTDFKIPFVFITSHIDESVYEDALSTKPDNYIVKPFNQNQIKIALDFIEKKYDLRGAKPTITLSNQYQGGTDIVEIEEVAYIKANGRYTEFYLANGKMYSEISTLQEALNKVGDSFLQVHRGYVVNKNLIKSIGKDSVSITTNQSIPVSRSRMKILKTVLR